MNEARILLAEDDLFTQFEVTRIIMASFRVSLVACFSPIEAIQLMKNIHFDFAFLDFRFPGYAEEGPDIIRALSNRPINPLFYFITGLDSVYVKEMSDRFREEGLKIEGVISKDIMRQQFKDILKKYRVNKVSVGK